MKKWLVVLLPDLNEHLKYDPCDIKFHTRNVQTFENVEFLLFERNRKPK